MIEAPEIRVSVRNLFICCVYIYAFRSFFLWPFLCSSLHFSNAMRVRWSIQYNLCNVWITDSESVIANRTKLMFCRENLYLDDAENPMHTWIDQPIVLSVAERYSINKCHLLIRTLDVPSLVLWCARLICGVIVHHHKCDLSSIRIVQLVKRIVFLYHRSIWRF